MGVPTAEASERSPLGSMLERGHVITVSINTQETIEFKEISVQPPGVEAGDPINTYTQYSDKWKTKAASVLMEMTELEMEVAYDPVILTAAKIEAAINLETDITVFFPDGSKVAFWGYLRSFIPGSMDEESRPTASAVIQPTNRDPSDGSEAGPVYVAPV